MKKFGKYILLIVFAAFIWGFALFDILSPAREFSELENRPLTQSPVFTARSLFNNTYTLRYEEYVNDQFAARDSWITVKSLGESALAKTENNGIAYGKNGYLFEVAASFDDRQLLKNIENVRGFAQMYPEESITFSIIPNASAILTDLLPKGMPAVDQSARIEEAYRSLEGESLTALDLTPALAPHRDEYIYYRTDHHWTTLGAFYACEAYIRSAALPFTPLESRTAHQVPDFYGTHYSKAKNWNAVPDIITWYEAPVDSVEIDGESADGLYDLEMFQARDKYAAFLRGNNGHTVIKTPHEGLGKLLLFKDSYGNSLVPFLTMSFSEIHVVDLRYFSEVSLLLEENDFDEIYVLYNFSTISQDLNLHKLIR